jgi:hypothetical protein
MDLRFLKERLRMHPIYLFLLVAALAISVPAAAQTVSVPAVGSDDGTLSMPKTTATIPDRIRVVDPDAPGGVRVRSNLADEPGAPPPAAILKDGF